MDESVTPSDEPERWLPVVGFEGLYEVSDLGRVRSVPRVVSRSGPRGPRMRIAGRILRIYPPAKGQPYIRVELCRDGKRWIKRVHSLVADAFLGPRPAGCEVCHGPGGKLDNRLVNLSIGTRKKNAGPDKRRDGTLKFGTLQSQAKLTDKIVFECRIRAMAGEAIAALAREFAVSETGMSNAIKGVRWRHVPFPDTSEPPAA